ncbi:MAG: proteasome-type protease [Acidimicrobiales bacterium]|nr:proteasome-type protease [Acidimicrobiales bacterium]
MTYCVGLQLDRGLVFMSDTRTNSGVDNISVFPKMHQWSVPGDRVITLLSAGNLATTQTVVSLLDERSKVPADRQPSILEVPTMFQVAELVGGLLRDTIAQHSQTGQRAEAKFNATLILGGQIKGMPPRLFLIYPEGNFIETSPETPFMQIGETKYGRPILLRAYRSEMTFEDAIKLLLVSFDSTIKANLSVGLPIDVSVYETDTLEARETIRITQDDEYYRSISEGWGEQLRVAVQSLPDFDFDAYR